MSKTKYSPPLQYEHNNYNNWQVVNRPKSDKKNCVTPKKNQT